MEMKMKKKILLCKICGKEFENYRSLSHHLRTHKITSKEYYDKFFKKEGEGVCPVCGKETSFHSINKGYCKFCSNKCANKGKRPSEETKKKLSNAKKGENNPFYGKHHSEKTKKKMSDAHIGKHHTEETKKKLSDTKKGKHLSEETKKKISDSRKGENHPNYKGGISLKEFKDAYGLEPTEWQKLAQEIRKRDNFTCQLCGKKGATSVHHIIPRRIKVDNSPENLITLCRSCHRKIECLTDKYLAEGKDPREIFFDKKISNIFKD
jgi:transcription elongation factor Elf1